MKKIITIALIAICQLQSIGQIRRSTGGGVGGLVNTPVQTAPTPIQMVVNSYSKKNGNTTLTIYKASADKTTKSATNKIVTSGNEYEDGNMICRSETRRYTAETMTQDILNPDAIANLRLGAVYSMEKMQSGNYVSVNTNRLPTNIYLSNASQNAIIVNNPDELSLQQALDRVRNVPYTATPSGLGAFMTTTQITSSECLNVAANLSYSGFGFNASNKFGYDKSNKSNKFLLSYINPTYTAFAMPASQGMFFNDANLNKENTYAYISQITYGIKLMVYFEDNLSNEDITNKFHADGFGVKADVDIEFKNRTQNTNFKIYLYGSNEPLFTAVKGFDNMMAKVDELLKNISIKNQTLPIQMGQPISYQLRFLDGDIAVTSCKVEDIPQIICGPNPNYPLDFSLNVDGIEFEGGSYYGWLDAEISGGEKPLSLWKADADAASFKSTFPNPSSPMLNIRFPKVSKANRNDGVLRIWYRMINRNKGGNDVFLNKMNDTNFDFANNGQHGAYKGNFVDFPLKDFLAVKPGSKPTSVKVKLANQDKSVTITLTPQFLF